MMKYILFIIFVDLFSFRALSQGIADHTNNQKVSIRPFPKLPLHDPENGQQETKPIPTGPAKPSFNEEIIPADFYTRNLGFFCRQELKMQDAHVPVSFRLGSLEYCNWLEQKPGYR
jgi:hypothetical protein